jgi:hypothetical protein
MLLSPRWTETPDTSLQGAKAGSAWHFEAHLDKAGQSAVLGCEDARHLVDVLVAVLRHHRPVEAQRAESGRAFQREGEKGQFTPGDVFERGWIGGTEESGSTDPMARLPPPLCS